MSAVIAMPPRMPRPTERTARSFVLALAMHALLFAALWSGVQWRTQSQGDVVAELWVLPPAPVTSAVEPVPTPTPAPPEPQPAPPVQRAVEPERPDADIVQEQLKQKKLAEEKRRADQKAAEERRQQELAQKKAQEEQQRKAEADRQKAAAAAAKAAEERELQQRNAMRQAEEDRIRKEAGGAPSPSAGAGSGRSGDAEYAAQIAALIKRNIEFAVPEGTSRNISAEFQVELLPTGEILSVKLVKASGLAGYDAAAERGISRTQRFPRKRDGTVERTMIVKLFPVER
jgi:colicin import membrane protein